MSTKADQLSGERPWANYSILADILQQLDPSLEARATEVAPHAYGVSVRLAFSRTAQIFREGEIWRTEVMSRLGNHWVYVDKGTETFPLMEAPLIDIQSAPIEAVLRAVAERIFDAATDFRAGHTSEEGYVREYFQLTETIKNPIVGMTHGWRGAAEIPKRTRYARLWLNGRAPRIHLIGKPDESIPSSDLLYQAMWPHLVEIEPTIQEVFTEERGDAVAVLEFYINLRVLDRNEVEVVMRGQKQIPAS